MTRVSDLGNDKVNDVTEGLDPSQESSGGAVGASWWLSRIS